MSTTTIKVWTNQTVHNRKQKGKKFPLPSLAVPDQTLTIHEMIRRHTKGQILPNIAKTPLFTEDSPQEQTGVNVQTLDLVDIQTLQVQNNTNITMMEEAKAKYNQEKVAQKQLKEREDELKLKAFEKAAEKNPEGQ